MVISINIIEKRDQQPVTWYFFSYINYDLPGVKADLLTIEKQLNNDVKLYPAKKYKALYRHYVTILTELIELVSPPNIKTGGDDDMDWMDLSIDEVEHLLADGQISDMADTTIESAQPISKISQSQSTRHRFVYDIVLDGDDKIIDIKKKITALTGIPIYRQHIWFDNKDGSTIPLSYLVYEDYPIYPNMPLVIEAADDIYNNRPTIYNNIMGIPLDDASINTEQIKIQAFDQFKLLKQYINQYGIKKFSLVDLNYFWDTAINKDLCALVNDKSSLQLLHNGFIILYYPMLCSNVFTEYVKSINSFIDAYPELNLNQANLLKQYKLERDIIGQTVQASIKGQKIPLSISITYSIISIQYIHGFDDFRKVNIINLRNLFDKIELSEDVNAVRYMYGSFMIHKTYENAYPIDSDRFLYDSLIIKFQMKDQAYTTGHIIFTSSGSYTLQMKWPEELKYTFDDVTKLVIKYVTPIIDNINSMGLDVLYQHKNIPRPHTENMKFSEVDMSILYPYAITESRFKDLKNILTKYQNAGIIQHKSDRPESIEYYFSKGMFQYDAKRIETYYDIDNYYQYLSEANIRQKWMTLFNNTRITRIYYRFTDIKINITGIKDCEFNMYKLLIYTLFYMFEQKTGHPGSINMQQQINNQQVKRISKLREQDPVLYRKNIDHSAEPVVYSKICQRPRQPRIISQSKYESLPDQDKKRAVKYKNFTSGELVRYMCPHKKYQYIHFIVGKHPEGYCYPCCKKLPVPTDPNNRSRIIHDYVLKHYIYKKTDIKTTATIQSQYIMKYTRSIDADRLAYIPSIIKTLLQSSPTIAATTCEIPPGYYIYGVLQNTSGGIRVGYLYILANIFERPAPDIIMEIIKYYTNNEHAFSMILNGNIYRYFADENDFVATIRSSFVLNDVITRYIPWNDILIDIARRLYNYNTIIFIDNGSGIELQLPNTTNNTAINVNQIRTDIPNIVVIRHDTYAFDAIYPIYYMNTSIYFSTGLIESKVYSYGHDLIQIVMKIIDISINKGGGLIQDNDMYMFNYGLPNIEKFIETQHVITKYVIDSYCINQSDLCYGLIINSGKNTDSFYIPVPETAYSAHRITTADKIINKATSDIIYKSSSSSVKKFISLYNKLYPDNYEKVNLTTALVHYNRQNTRQKRIGFVWKNLHFYCKIDASDTADILRNIPKKYILHDPYDVNRDIINGPTNILNRVSNDDYPHIYDHYKYKLLVTEFIYLINKLKNKRIRKLIQKGKWDQLKKQIGKADYKKLQQIQVNTNNNMKLIMQIVDDSTYDFDKQHIEQLKQLPYSKLVKALTDMAKSITIITEDKVKTLRNIIMPCSGMQQTSSKKKQHMRQNQCKNNKLIFASKKELDDNLRLLANDILNPLKSNWLLSDQSTLKYIDFYNFIRRPSENITIQRIAL